TEDEADLRTRDLDMPVSHRRQAVGPVVAGVLVIADADERLLEELHDRGEDLGPRQAGPPQIGVGAPADRREGAAELNHPPVLGIVPDFTPARVISVLLPASRVPAGSLQVAAGVGADP